MDRDMFDTMTLTKIAAALCSALLVLVLGGWIADKIYSPAHHGEYHGVAWIETDSGDEEEDEAEAEEGPMLDDLLASADLDKGAKVFKKCAACHKLEAGANGVGPHLYAVVIGSWARLKALDTLAALWRWPRLGALKTLMVS
jgi:cytochrome c